MFFSVVPPFQQCKLNGCSSPCFVDPNTGVVYDCCRRSHGIQFNMMKQKELLDSGIRQAPTGQYYYYNYYNYITIQLLIKITYYMYKFYTNI